MTFTPQNVRLIKRGRKTQTRRILASPYAAHGPIGNPVMITQWGRRLTCVGQRVAIQPGRGKKGVGFFRITALKIELLQDITLADARKEGVGSVEEYYKIWVSLYGHRSWVRNPIVLVREFELEKKS